MNYLSHTAVNRAVMTCKAGFPGGASGKNAAADAGDGRDTGWIPGASGKNAAADAGEEIFLGREDPPEKRTATHCTVLAWTTPCTEELGGLQSVASHRVGHV